MKDFRWGRLLGHLAFCFAIAFPVHGNEPVISVDGVVVTGDERSINGPVTVAMTTAFPDGHIFYTTDGSVPSFEDDRYTAPITISESTTLRAIAYSSTLVESAERSPLNLVEIEYFTLTVDSQNAAIEILPEAQSYAEGTVVTVKLLRPANTIFVGWEGTTHSTELTISLVMDRNHSIYAVFRAYVGVIVIGEGEVTAEPRILSVGEESELTAVPSAGYRFVRWEVPENRPWPQHRPGSLSYVFQTPMTQSTAVVTVPGNWPEHGVIQPITAIFAPLVDDEHTLTLDYAGGEGSVEVDPPGSAFDHGQVVNLTAIPLSTWMGFAGWTGSTNSKELSIDFVMDEDKSITANFVGEQLASNIDLINPNDEDGNKYVNSIGGLRVTGPTRNWTYGTFVPPFTEGMHTPVSIATDTVYTPTFVQREDSFDEYYRAIIALTRAGAHKWTRTNLCGRVAIDSKDRPYVGATANFHALDPATGETVWQGQGTNPRIGASDRVYSFAGSSAYIYNSDGTLFDSFTATGTIENLILGISGDIFLTLANGIARVNSDGEVLWSSPRLLKNLTLADNGILLGSADGRIYGLDSESGEQNWFSTVLPSQYQPFAWSLNGSGILTVGVYAFFGNFDYFINIQLDAGLSRQSPWPSPGGDVLNRGKTQWTAPFHLNWTYAGGALTLSASPSTRPLKIYASEDLTDWQLVTTILPGESWSPALEEDYGFYKAAAE